jgi:hypothetical protein
MIDRASFVGILAHRVMVVGTLALLGGATACATAPTRAAGSSSFPRDCRVGSAVVRVINSGSSPVDLFVWRPLASGGYESESLGAVAPGQTEAFALGKPGIVQTSDVNQSDRKVGPRNPPQTLRYEYSCTESDRAG